jgi:hypothetical protein
MDFTLKLAFFAIVICLSRADLLMPPAFTLAPPSGIQYFTTLGEGLTLPCVATGNPKPNYSWKFNEQTLNINPIADGTIVIHGPLSSANSGFYQCFAHNSQGIVMSNTTQAVLATQASFAESQLIQLSGTLGLSLKLSCTDSLRNLGIPPPRPSAAVKEMTWRLDSGGALTPNMRMQIDDSGNLNIAYLMQEDFTATTMYTCYLYNRILKVDVGGTPTQIINSDSAQVAQRAPAIMFYTNQTGNPGSQSTIVVGLEGKNVSVRCFFSGSPSISVTWQRTDGGSIPTDGRVLFINFNIEMIITNAQKSDEGQYQCTGSVSGLGAASLPITLSIQAVPRFVNMIDGPRNFNASVGEFVRMNCSARAFPDASIVWFKNGDKIDPAKLPPGSKYQFTPDLKMLTYGPVCKDNCTGGNDLMVLACNASNIYGYALSNGYINAFDRTVFTSKSANQTLMNQKEVSFTVMASTDFNTPLTYTWYKKGDCVNGWCTMYNVTDENLIITNSDGSSTMTIFSPQSSDATNYKCVASNGVSIDEAYFLLDEPILPAYVWPYWWVPFIILLIVLLTILIVCLICCYMYRNRGDEYPVDEKERAADRNPEKELVDSGFHDFQRPTSGRSTKDEERQPLHM